MTSSCVAEPTLEGSLWGSEHRPQLGQSHGLLRDTEASRCPQTPVWRVWRIPNGQTRAVPTATGELPTPFA